MSANRIPTRLQTVNARDGGGASEVLFEHVGACRPHRPEPEGELEGGPPDGDRGPLVPGLRVEPVHDPTGRIDHPDAPQTYSDGRWAVDPNLADEPRPVRAVLGNRVAVEARDPDAALPHRDGCGLLNRDGDGHPVRRRVDPADPTGASRHDPDASEPRCERLGGFGALDGDPSFHLPRV